MKNGLCRPVFGPDDRSCLTTGIQFARSVQRSALAGASRRMIPHDLPQCWVVERSFGWEARFRPLARDYERLPETLLGLHFLAFADLMLKRVVETMLIAHHS